MGHIIKICSTFIWEKEENSSGTAQTLKALFFCNQSFYHWSRQVMKNPQLKQDGRKPGTNGMRSVRIVARLFFLFLVSGFLAPPFGFSAGKDKMIDRIDWPLEAAGWKWDRETGTFKGDSLYNYIDGAAEVYLAYNFRKVAVQRYLKSGQPDIVAEVYQMGSSEDAYGVFSLEQQDPEAGIGQGSEFGGSLLRFWKGRYFATVLGNGTGKELEEAVLSLGRELARGIKETGEPPRLLRCLPERVDLPPPEKLCFVRSHVLLNRCFFISHQNLLRLAGDVQAVLARYSQGKNKLRLLLVRYPTTARARSAYTGFQSAYLPEAGPRSAVRTEDGVWTRAEHYNEFIGIVFGAGDPAEAEQWVQTTVAQFKKEKR